MLTPRNVEWVAAFLEGEGFFGYHKNPHRGAGGGNLIATADQKDIWPLEKLVRLIGGKIYVNKKNTPQQIYVWQLRGKAAAALMMTLYGELSPRRRHQIVNALGHWKALGPHNANKTHCKRGHAFTPENTITFQQPNRRPGRRCRTCDQTVHSTAQRRARRLGLSIVNHASSP